MGELRCVLNWQGKYPRIVIEIDADLTDGQVRELAQVLARTAEKKLVCMGCGMEICPEKGEEHGRAPGGGQTHH